MTQQDYENLGTKLKELRIHMNLTQADVASALQVTPGFISNVENNRTAMSLRLLIFYAELMDVTLDSLIGLIDSEYKKTALNHELLLLINNMDIQQQEKLLQTIKIWQE